MKLKEERNLSKKEMKNEIKMIWDKETEEQGITEYLEVDKKT